MSKNKKSDPIKDLIEIIKLPFLIFEVIYRGLDILFGWLFGAIVFLFKLGDILASLIFKTTKAVTKTHSKTNNKSYDNNYFTSWEQKEVDKGNYDKWNFEEEDLEEDDYYYEDDE